MTFDLPDHLTKKEWNVLSLGAGVQSTALALMSHKQVVPDHVPRFDCAIFADTGEEPDDVYEHLEWLIKEVAPSFTVLIRSRGKLGDDLQYGGREKYDGSRFASIPAFTTAEDGESVGGMVRRQCTSEYKTSVIDRAIRRDIIGLKPKQRIPNDVTVHQYVGLSFDEPGRVFGNGNKPGAKARIEATSAYRAHFPLYEMFLTRKVIRGWLDRYGIPHVVPRSACTFCPFHSDPEWIRLKADTKAWGRIVEIDRALRSDSVAAKGMARRMYLHRSCLPIDQVEFDPTERPEQNDINFSAFDCEGMCGV